MEYLPSQHGHLLIYIPVSLCHLVSKGNGPLSQSTRWTIGFLSSTRNLGGGFTYILPQKDGKWSNLMNIFFQLGWNHHLAIKCELLCFLVGRYYWEKNVKYIAHRIYVWHSYLHIYHKHQLNVGIIYQSHGSYGPMGSICLQKFVTLLAGWCTVRFFGSSDWRVYTWRKDDQSGATMLIMMLMQMNHDKQGYDIDIYLYIYIYL